MKQGQKTNQIWTQEAGTHDTHDRGLTLLPPPERRVPRRNSSTGEGGWALWRPLRTNTDRNTGRGPPERNRQRRPWQSWELWRPWRSWELWRPWRCRELRRPWQVVFGALASVPSARPPQPEPFLPHQKKIPGEVRGYQEPSGAKQTGQDRDRTTHRNKKPSWAKLGSWGFLWAWRGVRGPYRVPQQPLPSQRQGGRRLEWPQTSLHGQDKVI